MLSSIKLMFDMDFDKSCQENDESVLKIDNVFPL